MSNHLISETSPYLQQHSENPVEWYPWGEEALTLAASQNKPILLSIGYSACHWCHVMAHESFEDPEVAQVMNQHFINIKVDREERPDLDHIYQTAHAMLTQRNGGWPLTMFLTPAQLPFFGGTYFPKTSRYNLPGFMELLPKVANFYHTQQADIEKQNASLLDAFSNTLPVAETDIAFSQSVLNKALHDLGQSYEPVYGGFGGAPKFPRPTDLEFCLRYAASYADAGARQMALHTLQKMMNGGIYDQLGGGFCRYSVDERWAIPHFEKMLYDNGPLLALYADVYLLSGDEAYKQTVQETAGWVMREMQAVEGGYFSSLDADTEHEEGKYYVWTPQEVAQELTAEEYAVVQRHYGLNLAPNFEGKYWHFIIAQPLGEVAAQLNLAKDQAEHLLASAKYKLAKARNSRVYPGRDEKILVSWNGLMIKGMAHAARVFGKNEWLVSAQQAVDFIRNTLWKNNRLFATYKDGKAHINAYLDDYAFMLDALLELMQNQFRQEDLEFARQLADVLLEQFEDKVDGGFYFTSHDHESLIHRPKPGHDSAMPSGNGVAANALLRLGYLLGDTGYINASERALALFYPALSRQPAGYMSLLMSCEEHLAPPQIVILRGSVAEMRAWQHALNHHYFPHTLCVALPDDIKGLPACLDKPIMSHVNAWVCQGVKCLPAISRLDELEQICKSSRVS